MNIFNYFKEKRQNELDFCECFVYTYNYLNKNQTMSRVAINKKNFKILKKHNIIKKTSKFFGEFIIYRVINMVNANFHFADVEIFIHKHLNDNEIEYGYKYYADKKINILTKDEILIKSIIE